MQLSEIDGITKAWPAAGMEKQE